MITFVKQEQQDTFTIFNWRAEELSEAESFLQTINDVALLHKYIIDLPENKAICKDYLGVYLAVNRN
jgi:hypothetical protein